MPSQTVLISISSCVLAAPAALVASAALVGLQALAGMSVDRKVRNVRCCGFALPSSRRNPW
jgi:hypothetical protein